MDALLGGLTKQAMNYAIKSGIAITANYVFQQSTKLIKKVEGQDRSKLLQLQQQLDDQMRIISPAIDMIELISARGNTSLESAKGLTKSLRLQIQALGQRIAGAVHQEERIRNNKAKEEVEVEIKQIMADIKALLARLEFSVPLINLAITTSGANLSGDIPKTVSPSRLLQASTFLSAGDSLYSQSRLEPVQIGPTFTLSLYMLFSGHARLMTEKDVRNTTWKEVIHKARLKLIRLPLQDLYDPPWGQKNQKSNCNDNFAAQSLRDEFAYQILLIEDLNDDRVHTYEDNEPQPERFQDIPQAGIKELIPIHEISKLFYADTGKILNISHEGEMSSPILLIRRDIHAQPPRKMLSVNDEYAGDWESDREDESLQSQTNARINHEIPQKQHDSNHTWKIPRDLDPEWLAFEVYSEPEDSDEEDHTPDSILGKELTESDLTTGLSKLEINTKPLAQKLRLPPIQTSLSLLEVLLRLLSLQQFQQASHLSVSDELLNFFLAESATTGAAGGDDLERRRIRNEAKGKLGFDPYDESPIKRRGENYQYSGQTSRAGGSETTERFDADHLASEPATPQHLLGTRPHLSPYDTPELPPLPRSASASRSPSTPISATAKFRAMQQGMRRESSPLANATERCQSGDEVSTENNKNGL
ncbi:MAG: hypothetical protein GOMPHAMPRED_000052 [Gomphillus americanus]|uniref:Ran-specific GTPase-activating protein 30 n=1 Tax=Gomphillus americanus TaxID=1940652 RepID=A0A8H3I0Y9_9LECA|nr:MAG: hypothetical protein GOMPHAMPRED_000052 [Gomphillus americanus]